MLEGRLKGGVRTLAGVLVALALGAGPAHAQSPDPLAPGPYGYKKIEYSAGNLMITIPPANGTASQTFPQPLEGSIIYPDTPGPWKVLVFMHGRHSTCITGTGGESSPPITSPDVTCDDTDNPDGTENTTKIQSWQGVRLPVDQPRIAWLRRHERLGEHDRQLRQHVLL